ncbi:MAG: acyl-CoA dehydrogenase [Desulfobacterales bacterium]|nr:acyl-CoA dehydrogenase [Desulfobacterales bacterium]
MAQLIADRRDVDFVLFEQMNVETLTQNEKFNEFDKKTIDLIVTEAKNLAIKEILPTQKDAEHGCTFSNGKVTVPQSFHKAYKLLREGDWLAMADDPKVGGQGMPKMVALAANEYFMGANCSFMLYHGLTHGAAKLIERLGTEEQKRLYMKKLFSGEWSGTMLLTEAEAGSDVGALTTSAKKNPDGTYSITGSKIFISGGEHDMVANIIHPVLARIEGAPKGSRGISLFIVPKYRVNANGSLGEFNDVVCTGIEEKTGLHGNSTCSLTLGSKGNCIGTLIGEENKGLPAMFLMMNDARQLVGFQGFGVSTAAYMYALDYARQRIQGKHLLTGKNLDAPSVAIIEHPDVKRQLMIMKTFVEGMRSLIYYTGLCYDKIAISNSSEEKEMLNGLIEVLTPIVKGYVTDKALEVTSHAVQVYGGYGYTKEFPVEQLFRDCRIFMIYEGTNGIHAIDLLGRKLTFKQGKPFMDFLHMIQDTINTACSIEGLETMCSEFKTVFQRFTELSEYMGRAISRPDQILNAYAFAHPYLEVTGDITMAWMHLWRSSLAMSKLQQITGEKNSEKLKSTVEKNKEAAFYYGLLKSAQFVIYTLLPVTMGKMNAIFQTNGAAVEIPDVSFGGK